MSVPFHRHAAHAACNCYGNGAGLIANRNHGVELGSSKLVVPPIDETDRRPKLGACDLPSCDLPSCDLLSGSVDPLRSGQRPSN